MGKEDELLGVLKKVVAPAVAVDKATLFLVSSTATDVHLHFGGAYSGCPGVPVLERSLLEPLVKAIAPNVKLKVTSGLPLPVGAKLVDPEG